MKYFTQDYITFFKELEKNNNRDWFQANKKRYEASVKEPFQAFVEALISSLSKIHNNLTMTPKEAIFRINRDIRFSKDKSPYKTHMAAIISEHGKKNHTRPGMYIQANHADLRVYSGVHAMDKDQLHNVRSHIAGNLKQFDKLINAAAFKKTFGEVLGEKNKRIPPEFNEAFEKQPLIANKSLYYFFKLPPKTLLSDTLIKQVVDGYKVGLPLSRFLDEPLA